MDFQISIDNDQLDQRAMENLLAKHRSQAISQYRWSSEKFEKHLAQSHQAISINPDNEQAVGIIMYREYADIVEVDYVFSDESFRSQGVMTQLFSELISRLKKGQKLWLEVHENNFKARSLYERLGLTISGRRKNYYSDKKDAILYSYQAQTL